MQSITELAPLVCAEEDESTESRIFRNLKQKLSSVLASLDTGESGFRSGLPLEEMENSPS